MADQYTPEEIAEIFEAYNNAVKSGTPISAELSRQLQDAAKSARGLAKAQEEFGKSLGKSALQLGSSLNKGEKGVGQFGDAIESAATALQTLILAIPGLGIVAKVATVAMGLLAKGVNAAAKQGDALYKTYQELGRVGATASNGISGVFDNMQKLGYGIEELDKMVQLVTQNSETLAKFSLTAADGTNAFAEGMARIQRDGQLVTLGKTTDDINSAGAAFIRQQVAMGRRQNDVQGQLGDRTKAYILELDRLQRLTGTSADALQKQQDELMSEDAYNVYMEMLESQGEAGKEQAAKIRATTALFPQYAKEIAQAIGGNVEAQGKLMFLMPNLIKDLRDPVKSFSATAETAGKDLETVGKVFKPSFLLAADATRDFIGSVKDMNQAQASATDIKAREKAAADGAKIQDTATKALSEAQIANMNTRDALQSMVKMGVAPATIALSKLAGAASGVATTGASAIGAPGAGGQRGAFSFDRARAASSDVDRILSTIRTRESGGNYGAQAKGSSASGAYQFIDSTWQSMTKKFGMGQEYSSAKMAPKDIQDAIAKAYVQDILKRSGGDVSKVPLEWYTGNIQGKMSPSAMAANNGLTPEMYQGKWLAEYQRQPGSTNQSSAEEPGWVSMLADKLDTLNRTNREQRDLQQKQLQATN
jgi:hypothetical protein